MLQADLGKTGRKIAAYGIGGGCMGFVVLGGGRRRGRSGEGGLFAHGIPLRGSTPPRAHNQRRYGTTMDDGGTGNFVGRTPRSASRPMFVGSLSRMVCTFSHGSNFAFRVSLCMRDNEHTPYIGATGGWQSTSGRLNAGRPMAALRLSAYDVCLENLVINLGSGK